MDYTDVYSLTDDLEAFEDEQQARRVCGCGHDYGEHDIFGAFGRGPSLHPCEADGCECRAFTEDGRQAWGMDE